MTTPIDIVERAASRSPGSFGFSMEGGQASGPWLVHGSDLDNIIQYVIGDVQRGNDGRLRRTLPLRHPRRSFGKMLYVERITSAEGVGTGFGSVAGDPQGNVPEKYSDYELFNLNLQWTPRRYQLIEDKDITVQGIQWTDEDGFTAESNITTEYSRFVEWEKQPANDMLVAERGVMRLARDTSQITNPPGAAAPHGFEFPGKPKIPIVQHRLFLTWRNVPAWYVFHPDSPLDRYANRVNLLDFEGYEAGELLYEGYSFKTYTPWNPAEDADVNGGVAGGVELLADIRLSFLARGNIFVRGPANSGNRLFRSPHNAAPSFLDRKWYSVVTTGEDPNDSSLWRPIYDSFPVQMLFTDPEFLTS